jgi:hypothetical protein
MGMADANMIFKAIKESEDMNSELTTDVRPDYESECKRLCEKMDIMREENMALTQAVKGLSVALDMSKKQRY